MAYNIIPNSVEELLNIEIPNIIDLTPLYFNIKEKYGINDPFAFDLKSKNVKVIRALEGQLTLGSLQKHTKNFTFTFGNGSRGNSGSNNRGLLFEKEFCDDLNLYIAEGDTAKLKYKQAILEITKTIPSGFYLNKAMTVGELNNRRPLNVENKIFIGSSNFDIGNIVSDITIECLNQQKKTHYIFLSLKLGNTVTFMNSGVTKYLNEKEIKLGEIKNDKGKKLLSLLNIDNKRFCKIFNEYTGKGNSKEKIDISQYLKSSDFKYFMQSVIGYGYVLVHKKGSNIEVINMDEKTMNSYIKVKSAHIIYPTEGSNKRVDIEVLMNEINVKINIRNKQGGLYPTHIMADYVMLH